MSSIADAVTGAVLEAVVPAELQGQRLDAAAAKLFPAYSRARLQQWIAEDCLVVNDRPADKRQPVAAGDRLRLQVPPEPEATLQPQAIALEVVYEDKAIAVIDKPAGLTVHPGAGAPDGTLQNALLHRYPRTAAVPRSGLIHRLDKDTSGLLVVALTLPAHTRLVQAMQAREIRREYDAVVAGVMSGGGKVEAPVGRHPRDRVRMAVVDSGRPAVTHYRVAERFTWHTHLRVRLETGRTHQIRVHMHHIRHPIVGDPVYGGRVVRGTGMPVDLRQALAAFRRQALHARELELVHPVTGKTLTFTAEPPGDMQELLDTLRRNAAAP